MTANDFPTLLNFFKLLSNESRLKLIGILSQRESSVEELAALLALKEPTVSHHLNKLKELNLVQMRQSKNTHIYQLNSEALQELSKAILTPEQMTYWGADIKPDAWEKKVLKNYLEGDRLLEIPASRKKRLIILKWLVKKFELGVNYSEREVNEVIKRYHPDSATLRREFIGYRLMQRKNGIYQRLPETVWKTVE
jgi:DNA-binding transcriptional ArsR family regulator